MKRTLGLEGVAAKAAAANASVAMDKNRFIARGGAACPKPLVTGYESHSSGLGQAAPPGKTHAAGTTQPGRYAFVSSAFAASLLVNRNAAVSHFSELASFGAIRLLPRFGVGGFTARVATLPSCTVSVSRPA